MGCWGFFWARRAFRINTSLAASALTSTSNLRLSLALYQTLCMSHLRSMDLKHDVVLALTFQWCASKLTAVQSMKAMPGTFT